MTLSDLRRHLRRNKNIRFVFVACCYSPDDSAYFEVTKTAALRTFEGKPGDTEVNATIRSDEPDAIYIN